MAEPLKFTDANTIIKGAFQPMLCAMTAQDSATFNVEVYAPNGTALLQRRIARVDLLDNSLLEAFICDSRARIERATHERLDWQVRYTRAVS